MANWCFTTYKIVGNAKEISILNNKLTYLQDMDEPLEPNGFGVLWLGCLVKLLGGDNEKINCRGEITEFHLNEEEGVLTVITQSAWYEMAEVRRFLKQVFPSLQIYYYEEECGCEIYRTNDRTGRFFPERYILDTQEVEGTTYYDDIESLLNDASEIFDRDL